MVAGLLPLTWLVREVNILTKLLLTAWFTCVGEKAQGPGHYEAHQQAVAQGPCIGMIPLYVYFCL